MKVTLQVNGREMTFSEQELIAIVEKHFASEQPKKAQTLEISAAKQQAEGHEIAQSPTEGKWFEVKLQAIDQKLFKKKRADERQEKTRQLILEAFAEVNANPEKYGRNFKTMMPKKTWNYKTVAEFEEKASQLGDHNADWVEQALEWAQRIANGETWKSICNDPDKANWYRLVKWQNGYYRLVGGSRDGGNSIPASDVGNYNYDSDSSLGNTVPLVVLYEK